MQEILKRMQDRIMQHQQEKGFESIFDFLNEDIEELQEKVKSFALPCVIFSEAELCGKPNCNKPKLDNSPLCSYHWDIANS